MWPRGNNQWQLSVIRPTDGKTDVAVNLYSVLDEGLL
jgi:hypothetical protein